MADNTQLSTGVGGDVIATDDIGGVKYQRVKETFGVDGVATDVSAANPLPTQIGDTGAQSSVFPAGFLRVTDEPTQVFYDPFDASPDTTNMWTTTNGNSGVAPAVASGTLSVGTGTVANGYSRILSIPAFKPTVPAWLGNSFAIALPDGAAPTANAYRFWGLFSSPTTPTTTAPLTDAVGFELTTAGKLQAVVWAAGVRTLIADLSSTGTNTQPLNATSNRYIVYVRTDKAYWYINGLGASQLVATSNFQAPAIQTLGTGILAIGGATPPVSNTQIQCAGLAVWDTGKNAYQIGDGTYPFRRLKVNADGSIPDAGSVTSAMTSISALNGDMINAVDVSAYKSASIQLTGTWVGTVNWFGSNDNITYYPMLAENIGIGVATAYISGTTVVSMSMLQIKYRYLRVRVTSYTSGTVTGTITYFSDDRSTTVQYAVLQAGFTSIKATTTNLTTTFSLSSAATTNATQVKTANATIYSIFAMNTTAATKYVRIYNKATAPTVGTDVPIIVIAVPATSSKEVSMTTVGIQMNTGIGLAITGAAAVTDATAVALNDVQVIIGYI